MYNKDIYKGHLNNISNGKDNKKKLNPKTNIKKTKEKNKKLGSLKSSAFCIENNKIEDINNKYKEKNKSSINVSKTKKKLEKKSSKNIEKNINDINDFNNLNNQTRKILINFQQKNEVNNIKNYALLNNKNKSRKKNNVKYINQNYITPENNNFLKNNKIMTKGENKNNNLHLYNYKNKIILLGKSKEEEKSINFTNPPLIVLKNNGNTTYINCSIQCLANFKNISDYYLKNLKSFKTDEYNMTVTYHLSQIFSHLFPLQEHPQNPYSLKPFHEFIIKINPIFKGKSTKNINDFFIFLLDILHKEDKTILQKNINNNIDEIDSHNFNKYLKYLKYHENSIIFQKFSWINKKVDVCWGCRNEEIKYQYYFTYDLDFENAFNKTIMNNKNEVSILDCIKYASEKKKIYNTFCSKCNKKNIFDRTSSIFLSQSVLVLLLRGMEDKNMIKKIINENIIIKINQNLDLSKFIEYKDVSFFNYTLHGVIFYDSEKLEYLAYCINKIDERWYKYTNGEINPCELNNFIDVFDFKTFPVLLLYRHL